MEKYDFFECVVYDIHCIPRGRMISKERFNGSLEKGIGLYAGLCYFSIKDDPIVNDYFSYRTNCNLGNCSLIPNLDTLVELPKTIRGDHRVCQVLCDVRLFNGEMELTTPRYVAQLQLQKLEAMGMRIRSSFEIEFTILDNQNKPWAHNAKWCNMDVLDMNQDVLLDFVQDLKSSKVEVDSIQCEAGNGQFEFNAKIAEGIKAADMTSRFKSMSRSLLHKRGLKASYSTKIVKDSLSNGFHFNHSILIGDAAGFYDCDKEFNLSEIGNGWMAGLIKHAAAITALLCPTVNCYRRLHSAWTPSKASWGLNDRSKAFRLVTESDGNIYMECRIPSSACNPYLVLAGTVAAGLDGITNKLSLENCDQEKELPRDLASALQALQDDEYIVEALGADFVEQFSACKQIEIDYLKSFGDLSDDQLLEKEMDLYLSRV